MDTDSKAIIAITADKGIPKSKLEQLSRQTQLPLLTPKIQTNYHLHLRTEHLELQKIETLKNNKQKIESIYVDFAEGKAQHRRLHGGGKGQDIAKAIGFHKIPNPTVLDLTAGMGADAFVLASLGASITMVERNPIVHALLKDAIDRARLKDNAELQEILDRMILVNQNATAVLDDLDDNDYPDVIYLDPMFPTRSKSAQVKKEMQFFHEIVGNDEDSESILLLALTKAKKRIVVKRPRLAEKLTQKKEPAYQITGKSTRYDIYLPKNQSWDNPTFYTLK